MKNIYLKNTVLALSGCCIAQIANAEDYSANTIKANSQHVDKSYYVCSENNYSNSKFDYKSHYVTSFRFTLPTKNCSPKSYSSLYKDIDLSGE